MYIYVLGMNITTNDNSLAWTLSDNTAGSGKQKRGAKVKVAQQSQDVVTSSITKYLGDSAKFEHSNTARQLSLQEEQLKLEQRKMALLEKEHADRQEYGNNYGNIMIGKDQSCDWQGSRYDDRQGYRYDERQGYRNDDRQGYRYDYRQGFRNNDRQGFRNDYRQGYRYDDRQGYCHGSSSSSSINYDRPAEEKQQLQHGDRMSYGITYERLKQQHNGNPEVNHTVLQMRAAADEW